MSHRSPISQLVRDLRMAVGRAKRTKDSTGTFDTTAITITIPLHVASIAANRLEQTESGIIASSKMRHTARREMIEITDIAEESLKDNALRFSYALTDLEILLETFVGRPPMMMQEVRQQRQVHEARPSPGPQPFIRKKQPLKASSELTKSLRSGRIGNPRDPGEDG